VWRPLNIENIYHYGVNSNLNLHSVIL